MFRKIARYSLIALVAAAALGALAWLYAPQTYAAPVAPAAVAQAPQVPPRLREELTGRALTAALVKITADATGVKPDAVLKELQAGKSLAQVAAAGGSSGDKVVQTVTDKVKGRLAQAVKNGRITQQESDQWLQRVKDEASKLVNDTTLGATMAQRQEQRRDRAAGGVMAKATADATGLPLREVLERARNGETLAQIATAAGKNPSDIVNTAVDAFRAEAEQAMSATR